MHIGISSHERPVADCWRSTAVTTRIEVPKSGVPREKKEMPFKATFRHQYWSVDVRYIEEHRIAGVQGPIYLISVLQNYSRAVLSSKISPTQNQWDYLVRRVGTGKISLKERGG